jgi:broad specificity phosphatase PhoE
MTSALFIRHAETNMVGTFCGHSDPMVNGKGQMQIAELLDALHDQAIDAVYSSDLQRAMTTARAISEKFRIPCIVEPNLREINFGKWEGLTWQQVQEADPDFARQWTEMFPKLTVPGGESFHHFEVRVLKEIASIFEINQDRKLAVVTHGGVMRVVLRAMCGLAESEAWALTKPYCSLFRYPFRPTP